jgi:hypothetical protein
MLYEPKLIQISTNSCSDGNSFAFALDDDGNVWELVWTGKDSGYKWKFIGSPSGVNKS